MAKRKIPPHSIEIPKELQASAKSFIEKAFMFFADQTKRLADDIAQFNKKREKVQRKIEDGARRTSGRII
jgi:hypothetical protein